MWKISDFLNPNEFFKDYPDWMAYPMAWETNDAASPRKYTYTPKWEKDVEQDVNKVPSTAVRHRVEREKRFVLTLLEVTNEGVLLLREKINLKANSVEPVSCAFFTWSEIRNGNLHE
jgi:hypothetical protein